MADTRVASTPGSRSRARAVGPAEAMAAMVDQGGDRAIAFDLGGVLLSGGVLTAGGEEEAFAELGRHFGIPPREAARVWRALLVPSELGTIPESDVWSALASRATTGGPAELRAAVLGMAVPMAGGVEVLEHVKAMGWRTALATNHLGSWIDEWRERFSWFALFDTVVYSAGVGVRKPDPHFYDLLLSEVGQPHPWFVDDREENVAAARLAGFRVVWVDPAGNWEVRSRATDGPETGRAAGATGTGAA